MGRQIIDLCDSFMGRDLPGDRELAVQVYRQSLEMFMEMEATGYIKVLEERLVRVPPNLDMSEIRPNQ